MTIEERIAAKEDENGYNSNFVKVNKMVKKMKKEETE